MLYRVTNEERERLRAEFLRRASEGFDRMFSPEQQPGLRTFTQREDCAMDIGTDLARFALEHHVDAHEKAKPAEAEPACPECGGHPPSSSETALETREVESRAGRVAIERSGQFCPRCRRRFFPSRP